MDTNRWSFWGLKRVASVVEAEAHGSMYEDVFLSLNDQGTPGHFHEFFLVVVLHAPFPARTSLILMVETIFQSQLSPKEGPFASSEVWMPASSSDGRDARDLIACPSISLLWAEEHPPLLAFELKPRTVSPSPMAWSH